MNIVYNCNDKFAVHTAVSITSLFENNGDADSIHVYILGNGLSERSISRYKEIADRYHTEEQPRTIRIIDLKDYESVLKMMFGSGMDTGSFDLTVLARIFAPAHLPDEVDRYIYLDADTIVLGDIAALYALDLGDHIAAMAAEPTIYAETRNKLKMREEEPYFNSGMILVDRLRWEKEEITSRCIDYYKSLGGRGLAFPDQDILNYILKGKVLVCRQEYNFFSNYHYQSYASLVNRAAWYGKYISKKEYEHAQKHPVMVHFAGSERPWLKGNHNPYKAEYKYYLEKTPWKDEKEQSGQEWNMFLYHMMNLLTKYCPYARILISKLYARIKLK